VLLHASTREHMNLVMYDGKKLPQLGDLPEAVRKLWGIKLAPPGARVAGSHNDGCAPLAHPDFQLFLDDGVSSGSIRPRLGLPSAVTRVSIPAAAPDGTGSADRSAWGRTALQRTQQQGSGGAKAGMHPSGRGGSGRGGRGGRGKRAAVEAAPAEAAWSETAWSRSLRPRGLDK
jgi:hypothetical protein